jgi:hypothetical protein
MGPAERKLHLAAFGQHLVPGIAVDLQHTTEAGEMPDWTRRFSIRGIDIGYDWRVGAAPWSVIACISKELTGFRPGSRTGAVVSSANSFDDALNRSSSR